MPLEVCEKVLGALSGRLGDYRTLSACALVCRAWVPRSRISLYQHVELYSAKEASRFTTTICSSSTNNCSSALGQLVYSLHIGSFRRDREFNGWIYKAFQVLPPLLTNLYHLDYFDLPVLHPSFHLWQSKFTTVRSLSILCSPDQKQSFREVVQIINAFKNLEKVEIYAKQKTLGLCYWKKSCRLKSLIVGSSDNNSTQDIGSWLLKDNARQMNSLNKLSLCLSSNILWRTILENYAQSLQSLDLDIWSGYIDIKSKLKFYLGFCLQSKFVSS